MEKIDFMNNNPYLALMLTDSATEEEINEAYERLKKQYSNDRFLEGEAGYFAAKKLTELEQAYQDILEDLKKKKVVTNFGSIYGEIEQLIKNGNLDDAQAKLDEVSERTAEWHYLQSIIFYRKNWHSESKKQLEIAVSLEPNNAKYREALTKLENVINAGKAAPPPRTHADGSQGGYDNPNDPQQQQVPPPTQQMAQAGNCCLNLWCADTCCECFGGDLIACC